MKAITISKYGPPEVLQLKEAEKPVPKANEVLIKIMATVTAPPDCAFRKGKPYASRLFTGLAKPKYIPGDVFSGIVEAVGNEVRSYKTGDEVYGSSGTSFGTNAEYIALPEAGSFNARPVSVTFGEAAAISEGALTALPFLRDTGMIKAGDQVLINGASGGVGVYAVQLAKYFGAEVTGVCSGANATMVKKLGADHIIDYTKVNFTKGNKNYDIIFDAVGKSSYKKCRKVLSPGGKYLSTVPTLGLMLQMLITSVHGKRKAIFSATGLLKPEEKRMDLAFLKNLIEAGSLKPVVDRSYPIERLSEAHSYVEQGHKKGSVIITIGH